jgi:hypothetical protein
MTLNQVKDSSKNRSDAVMVRRRKVHCVIGKAREASIKVKLLMKIVSPMARARMPEDATKNRGRKGV